MSALVATDILIYWDIKTFTNCKQIFKMTGCIGTKLLLQECVRLVFMTPLAATLFFGISHEVIHYETKDNKNFYAM